MKKAICICLCLCVVLLCGCDEVADSTSTQPSVIVPPVTLPTQTEPTAGSLEGYRIPTIDEDFWEVLCENCDITVYRLGGGQTFLSFTLVSTQNLNYVPITVASNLGGSVTRTDMFIEEPTPMTIQAFLAYQGEDWAAFEGDWGKLRARQATVAAAFEQVQASLPRLYCYVLIVNLYDMGMAGPPDENGYMPSRDELAALPPQYLETLTVTIGEQTKTYQLDAIAILPEDITPNPGFWNGISPTDTLGIMDYAARPSADGVLKLPDLSYKAKVDVVLDSFTIPGAEVEGCDMTITTPLGDKFNFRWDCNSPIEVDEGSQILLENIVMRDPVLANTLVANIWRYQILTYTVVGGGEYDGQQLSYDIPISIRIRQDAWDAYAWYVDGVDLLPYYLEFKNYKG